MQWHQIGKRNGVSPAREYGCADFLAWVIWRYKTICPLCLGLDCNNNSDVAVDGTGLPFFYPLASPYMASTK